MSLSPVHPYLSTMTSFQPSPMPNSCCFAYHHWIQQTAASLALPSASSSLDLAATSSSIDYTSDYFSTPALSPSSASALESTPPTLFLPENSFADLPPTPEQPFKKPQPMFNARQTPTPVPAPTLVPASTPTPVPAPTPTPSQASNRSINMNSATGQHKERLKEYMLAPEDPSVMQALDFARESEEGASDPKVNMILEGAIARIWGKILACPDSYLMTRDQFSVFNYFQARFKGDRIAMDAKRRYWDTYQGGDWSY